jgi:hypothetical protein
MLQPLYTPGSEVASRRKPKRAVLNRGVGLGGDVSTVEVDEQGGKEDERKPIQLCDLSFLYFSLVFFDLGFGQTDFFLSLYMTQGS